MASKSSSGGIGFTGLLLILFIALKLTHVIDWPWLWVLSPAWISAAMVVVFLVLIFSFMFIKDYLKERSGR